MQQVVCFCVHLEPQQLAALTLLQDTEKQVCNYLLPFPAEQHSSCCPQKPSTQMLLEFMHN